MIRVGCAGELRQKRKENTQLKKVLKYKLVPCRGFVAGFAESRNWKVPISYIHILYTCGESFTTVSGNIAYILGIWPLCISLDVQHGIFDQICLQKVERFRLGYNSGSRHERVLKHI